jgi:hypothetical protein
VYEGLEIKRELGTDCVLINGQLYSVPANGKCAVEADNASISFGYFTEDAEVLDW